MPLVRLPRVRHDLADRDSRVRTQQLPGPRIARLTVRRRCTGSRPRNQARTAPAPAMPATDRAGTWTTASACRRSAACGGSERRSRPSADCRPSSCPGRTNRSCCRRTRLRQLATVARTTSECQARRSRTRSRYPTGSACRSRNSACLGIVRRPRCRAAAP